MAEWKMPHAATTVALLKLSALPSCSVYNAHHFPCARLPIYQTGGLMAYQLTINGQTHELDVDGDMPLLWAVRDHLN